MHTNQCQWEKYVCQDLHRLSQIESTCYSDLWARLFFKGCSCSVEQFNIWSKNGRYQCWQEGSRPLIDMSGHSESAYVCVSLSERLTLTAISPFSDYFPALIFLTLIWTIKSDGPFSVSCIIHLYQPPSTDLSPFAPSIEISIRAIKLNKHMPPSHW